GEPLTRQARIRDRSGRDPQPGKGRVEYPAAVQLQMGEARGPLAVIQGIGKGWSEQDARGPARGGGGERGRAKQARGARRGRQQPQYRDPREQRAERVARHARATYHPGWAATSRSQTENRTSKTGPALRVKWEPPPEGLTILRHPDRDASGADVGARTWTQRSHRSP